MGGVHRKQIVEGDDGELFFTPLDKHVVVGDGHDALEEVLHLFTVAEEDVGALGDLFELVGGSGHGNWGIIEYEGVGL